MQNATVLIVDDMPIVRAAIAEIIKNKFGSKQIVLKSNGHEALKFINNHKVDIIISDYRMPSMNGVKFLREVRKKFKEIPFIMVSGSSELDLVQEAVRGGVSQYIVKPFAPAELENKIISIWGHIEQRKTNRYASLPKHRVQIRFGDANKDEVTSAAIENISDTGVLLRLKSSRDLNLYNTCNIIIEVETPDKSNIILIDSLSGKPVRIERKKVNDDSSADCYIAFHFTSTSGPAKENLNLLIKWLANRNPIMVGGE